MNPDLEWIRGLKERTRMQAANALNLSRKHAGHAEAATHAGRAQAFTAIADEADMYLMRRTRELERSAGGAR